MKKIILLLLFAGMWGSVFAQSDKVKRLNDDQRVTQLFQQMQNGASLTKEQNEFLSPYWSRLKDNQPAAQRGPGGTPSVAAVTGYVRTVLSGQTYTQLAGGTTINTVGGLTSGTVDDGRVLITLPFTFTYDGTTYTQATMTTNGWVAMGDVVSTSFTPADFFTTTLPNSTIAAWFRDGNLNAGNGGSLVHGLDGTDVYVFEWRNSASDGSGGTSATLRYNAQVRIYGPASATPGRVELLYGTAGVGISTGASIGIEDATGGSGRYINALNGSITSTTTATAWVGNGNGYRFDPPPPIDASPTAATLPVGQLFGGTAYNLTVTIANNGTSNISAGYPVSYSVNGGPTITDATGGPAITVGNTAIYTFTGANALVPPVDGGLLDVTATVTVPGDGNAGNNTATIQTGRYAFPSQTVLAEDFNNPATFSGGTAGGPAGLTAGGGWLTLNQDGSTNAPFFVIPPPAGALTAFEGQSIANIFNRANGLSIDDYLITPQINGYDPAINIDSVVFYTRRRTAFSDSIDIRLSPGIGVPAGTSAASFTVRVAYIVSPFTPNYNRIAFRLNGSLPIGTTNYRVALRYLAFDGGSSGANTDAFAIDAFSIRRVAIPATPAIGVSGNSNAISNGSVTPSVTNNTDFRALPTTLGARALNFSIQNSGLAVLNLTGVPRVQITGANASDFTVTAQPAATVAVNGGSTAFTIEFDPSAAGTRTATVSIVHDGANTSTPFTFAIQGTGVTPISLATPYSDGFETMTIPDFSGGWTEEAVSGGLIDWQVLGNGANPTNTPFAGVQQAGVNTAGTFAGERRRILTPFFTAAGSSADAQLTFQFFKSTPTPTDNLEIYLSTNGGVTFALLTTIARVGTANQWELQTVPLPATQNNAGIQIAFEAVGGGGGAGNMFIDNVVVQVLSGPTAAITGNNNPVANGSVTPSLLNFTDFGIANTGAALRLHGGVRNLEQTAALNRSRAKSVSTQGKARSQATDAKNAVTVSESSTKGSGGNSIQALPGTITRTYTITNSGVSNLTIGTISFTGANASDFTVTTPPTSPIAPSASTTFQVTFNPSGDGVRNAIVSIVTNDAANNPYTFAIRGTGITSLTLPYVETFTGVPAGWTIQGIIGDPIWFLSNPITLPNGSTGQSAQANFFNAGTGSIGILQSPFLTLQGTTNPVLQFDVAYRTFNTEDDQIEVVISTDGGTTFQTGTPVLYNKSFATVPSMATLPPDNSGYEPAAVTEWRHETVNLTQFAGQSDLIIGFRGTSQFGNNAFLANVVIVDAASIAVIPVSGNGSQTAAGATVNFTNFGSGGNLYITRFNNTPPSQASPVFATNGSATTQQGSTFTPSTLGNRWWSISYDGQDYLATALAYSAAFDITALPGATNPNNLYVIKRIDRTASWQANSTTTAGNTLTAAGQTRFSDFGIGGDPGDNVLPVDLTGFTGRSLAQGITLNWATGTERDNLGFEVQRKEENTEEFVALADYRTNPQQLRGNGTTVQAHNYTFADNAVENGKTYTYRLVSVDLDGARHTYPQTVAVRAEGVITKAYSFGLMQNYPNPFNPSTVITYEVAKTSDVRLEVYDMLGRKITTLVSERKNAGRYSVNFNSLPLNLASGVYFYQLRAGEFNKSLKFILIK
jgi:hypothetical protein